MKPEPILRQHTELDTSPSEGIKHTHTLGLIYQDQQENFFSQIKSNQLYMQLHKKCSIHENHVKSENNLCSTHAPVSV